MLILLGVSSIVRALGLAERCYDRLLDFFHSPAIELQVLTRLWTARALALFPVVRFAGKPVLVSDGIKIPKCGRKMPAVKLLHQQSESNTKPSFVMGHSIQVVSMLVSAAASFFAVPLAERINEGVKFTNRDQRTLPEKFVSLLHSLAIGEPFYLVADAYYACNQVALPLHRSETHLVSRVRPSSAAYQSVPASPNPRSRGRPRLYGQNFKLWDLFNVPGQPRQFAHSPMYGERGLTLRFLCLDLLCCPLQQSARFVHVDHPTRGRSIFLSTDVSLPVIDIIRLYGLRFKIELSFEQAVRVIGAYAHHFWMRDMNKTARGSGTQHLHHKSDAYRETVRRKIAAYHRHIQIGLISQGVLHYLALSAPRLVWASFGSWLRTIRPGIPPSELVTATALRNTLPEFLANPHHDSTFKKFLRENTLAENYSELQLTG